MNSSCKHICKILNQTKNTQDVVYDFMSSYYKNFLPGQMGDDTIPFMLFTQEGEYFETSRFIYRYYDECVLLFTTKFFRVEKLDEEKGLLTVRLLLPLDIDRNITNSVSTIYRLEKTKFCTTFNLQNYCGIQFADPRLVNRKWPVIENKW